MLQSARAEYAVIRPGGIGNLLGRISISPGRKNLGHGEKTNYSANPPGRK